MSLCCVHIDKKSRDLGTELYASPPRVGDHVVIQVPRYKEPHLYKVVKRVMKPLKAILYVEYAGIAPYETY